MAVVIPAGPRTLAVGNAPATQTGAGGQWANAWSVSGVTAVHKSDASNAAEAWMAVKYTDMLPTTLGGGDIYRGDLGVSGQNSATSSTKQEIDGKEALRFNFAEAAQALTLNLSAFYAGDDGSSYAEGARIRLFDINGNLVGESFVRADSSSGNQLVQINSAQAFRAIEISAGARKGDGSFSYGAYYNSDGSFGTDSYTSGAKHGSDLLVHALSVTLATPKANADSYSLNEDAAAATYASVLGNDTDPAGASLTALLQDGPSHGTLVLNSNGTFTYTPDADYFGADSFTYRASNGKDASEIATVNLSINAVNDVPVAVNDITSTNEDTAITGNLLANDTDRDGDTLAVSNPGTYTTARGATLVLNADGSYSYDPTKSAELQAMVTGNSKVDSFTYTVSDGHGGATSAQLSVTVLGRDEGGGAVMLPSTSPGTELSYYMRYTTTGSATKWIKLDGFSMGVDSATTISKAGTLGFTKATPGNFTMELGSGKALAELTSSMMSGTPIYSIEIEAYQASKDGPGKDDLQLVQEYRFSGALVTGSASSAGDNGATSNTLSFAYRTVHESVSPISTNGRPVSPQEVRWNVAENDTSLPSNGTIDPGPDADIGRLDGVLPSDTPLEYYVHIDGVAGWVPLSSFSAGYSAESSIIKGGGSSVGRPQASELTMGLGLSQALTTLFKNEIGGKQATLQVEAYARVGGANVLVDEYHFGKAVMSGLDSTTGANNEVSLAYGNFTHAHLAYDSRGLPDKGNSTSVGYDFDTLRTITAPAATADALTAPMVGTRPGAELTYYLRYTDGTSTSKWILIDGFSLGVDSEVGAPRGSGPVTGKAAPDNFTLELGAGKALTTFTARLMDGKPLTNVEIEAYQEGARGPELVQELRFTGALVTSSQVSTGAHGATLNTLEFAYRSVDQVITPLDASGRPTTAQEVAWNIEDGNTALPSGGAVDPGPDARPNALAPQVDTGASMEYYIHVDGVTGWVALSSFKFGFEANSGYLKGGGASVGRPAPSELTVELGLNQVLAKLFNNEIGGVKNAAVQVEAYVRQPGGALMLSDEYFFNGVLTSGITTNNSDNTVSLAYDSFTRSHLAYDTNGKPSAAESSSVGYDFSMLRAITAPAANAEALTKATMPSVGAGAELHYYLHYGSNGADKWMLLDGFSMSVDSAISSGGGRDITPGNAAPGAFTLDIGSGKVIDDFTRSLMKGQPIDRVEIEAYQGNVGAGGAKPVQEFRFTDVMVTSAQTAAGAGGATEHSLSFVYGTLHETLSPPDANGKPVTPQSIAWDVENNTTGLPSDGTVDAGPDADINRLTPLVSSDTPLEYYLHLDGLDGWIALSSFGFGFTAESSLIKGGGTSVGRPEAGEVTLGMGLNQVLTTLLNKEIGASAASIQVEAYVAGAGAGGKPVLVDEYFFNVAGVTGVDSSSGANNEVSLVYTTFTHSHLVYDAKGKLSAGDSSSVGYDFHQVQVIGVPAAVAEVYHG